MHLFVGSSFVKLVNTHILFVRLLLFWFLISGFFFFIITSALSASFAALFSENRSFECASYITSSFFQVLMLTCDYNE